MWWISLASHVFQLPFNAISVCMLTNVSVCFTSTGSLLNSLYFDRRFQFQYTHTHTQIDAIFGDWFFTVLELMKGDMSLHEKRWMLNWFVFRKYWTRRWKVTTMTGQRLRCQQTVWKFNSVHCVFWTFILCTHKVHNSHPSNESYHKGRWLLWHFQETIAIRYQEQKQSYIHFTNLMQISNRNSCRKCQNVQDIKQFEK